MNTISTGPNRLRVGGPVRRLATLSASLVLVGATFPVAGLARSDSAPVVTGPEVTAAVHSDVSAPLRNLGPTAPSAANLRERPLRMTGPGSNPNQADGAVQAPASAAVATSGVASFDGLGVCAANGGCYAPPDTVGAVGATQYVQWVNAGFAVYDKVTGAMAPGFPKTGNAPWTGFGGGCETNNDGDPIVQYDKAANRWILTQFSVSTTPYLQCVAVSQTSDATGAYNRYAFSYSAFNDYPKLGVWPDAYYVTFNMFTSSFQGPKVCAYDRAAMLAGTAATQQCFQLSSSAGSLLPGDLDGSTPPPAGAPNPILGLGSNSLNLWRFHVDWANPANSTLSGSINIPVASYSRACNGSNCVPQPGTRQKLDSLGDRLMYRLAYRNIDGHESLVVNHSVSVGGNLFTSGTSSVRWYELRNVTSGTPSVFQQGTLDASDGIHRWMGSIAMDQSGDIAVGYSASSGSVYPSIRYTGRVPTDPMGTMAAESIIQPGTGSQLQNLSRWGDYSAMTIDPVDDCTFWYTSEYLKTNGTWNWSTRIASFKFPSCGGSPTPDFSIGASPTTLNIVQGGSDTSLISTTALVGSGTVALGASVAPSVSGITTSLSPGSVTAGSNSTLTVNVPAGTTPAAYTVTVTGTEGSTTHSTAVTVTVSASVGATAPGVPTSLSASPGPGKGITLTWTAPTNDGGSAITGYNVYRNTTGAAFTSADLYATSTSTKYKDTGTSKGVTYTYAVTAVNSMGESGFSNTAAMAATK